MTKRSVRDFKRAAANDLDEDFERAIEFDDYLDDRRDGPLPVGQDARRLIGS